MSADTVSNAGNTPDVEQPWAELGLKPDEYQRIRDILDRRPTSCELAMYSVMWSEHCSYKSSKVHLRRFGEIPQETPAGKMLAGIGENAGVIDIGEGYAVTFKVESHNHPSYVEPYQGAATGVGGIVRDILAMGARPVAAPWWGSTYDGWLCDSTLKVTAYPWPMSTTPAFSPIPTMRCSRICSVTFSPNWRRCTLEDL